MLYPKKFWRIQQLFKMSYIVLIQTFSIINSRTEDFNSDTRTTAATLLQSLLKFETILTAQLYLKIFRSIGPLSKYLQTDGMDIIKAQQMVDSTTAILRKEQRNIEDILKSAENFVQLANNELELIESEIVVEDCLPNIRTRRKRKMAGETADDNPPATAISKFEIEVHSVAMDCILNKMEE